ncbi:MAG TPA: ATP-dependent sacrificial sulfur transferase LarE [Thermoplasmata archaeon]|nr:ATP-dependent sacrificial sulfur transferase LarE [Thermoplasmata archaeon]
MVIMPVRLRTGMRAEVLEDPSRDRSWEVERVVRSLRGPESGVVAMSGGVDSAVVAALLVRALGARAHAVTLTGPAVTSGEVDRSRAVARFLGIQHTLVPADPLESPEYRANPTDRCYFCRSVETAAIRAWGRAHGVERFYDGVHRDDLGEDRPGIRAMEEAGFRHPLVEAGWGKAHVRRFARSIGLPNADQPSDACLASRIRHGQSIDPQLLGTIARAEEIVRRRGFRRVRVRVDGTSARVEVDPAETPALLAEPLAGEVRRELLQMGFDPVTLDPAGYRGRPGQ